MRWSYVLNQDLIYCCEIMVLEKQTFLRQHLLHYLDFLLVWKMIAQKEILQVSQELVNDWCKQMQAIGGR